MKSRYIFESPVNEHSAAYHDVYNLWQTFTPIILVHNHRQGSSKDWAESLNRFRVGIVTENDEQILKSRQTEDSFLDETALHIFYTNAEVSDHNDKMLNKISGDTITLTARKFLPKGYKSKVSKHGTIDDSQFLDKLVIKNNARCVLIYNVNIIDNLVNGSAGTIIGIERNDENSVICVVVQFDDKNAGILQRQSYPRISKKYASKNGTPIYPQDLEYQTFSRKGYVQASRAKLRQFPLKINYASTAHRMQVSSNNEMYKKNISFFLTITCNNIIYFISNRDRLSKLVQSWSFIGMKP